MRNIVSQSDLVLKESTIGHAHARALHFIWRHQGLSVAELLGLLHITKQSLNRVLSDLLATGYIERRIGRDDKRKRALYLTASGEALAEALWQARRPLLAAAFRGAGQEAVEGFRQVLFGLVDPQDRANIPP